MKKSHLFLASSALVLSLAGCGGGGGGGAPMVATGDVAKAMDSTAASAVVNTAFDFTAGVPAFGTTAPTTVSFTSAGANPGFSISSGSQTASGTTTFGSCIFTVTTSDFDPPHPLAEGEEVRVDPCNLNLETSGTTAGGATQVSTMLVLGTLESDPVPVPVQISPSGAVVINGVTVAVVTVTPTTGATSP